MGFGQLSVTDQIRKWISGIFPRETLSALFQRKRRRVRSRSECSSWATRQPARFWTRNALGAQRCGDAQPDDHAQRYGQSVTDALDDALGAYLEWERTDYREAVEGIRRGYEDVRAGRTAPAAEFFAEMRRKYGLPGRDNAGIRTRRGSHS